jgi:hypothetical protein
MPPTPSRESGSNYQLSDGTPSRAGAINNACDSRYSFLIALEGSLLAEVGSACRGYNIVQRVNEEALPEKHQKQNWVGHILNQVSDCPADASSS